MSILIYLRCDNCTNMRSTEIRPSQSLEPFLEAARTHGWEIATQHEICPKCKDRLVGGRSGSHN